jgi:hypothetical protein
MDTYRASPEARAALRARLRATAAYPVWAGLWHDPRNVALLSGETSDRADRAEAARSIARRRTVVIDAPGVPGGGPSRT